MYLRMLGATLLDMVTSGGCLSFLLLTWRGERDGTLDHFVPCI